MRKHGRGGGERQDWELLCSARVGRPHPPPISQRQPSLRSFLLMTRASTPSSSSSCCCRSRGAGGSRPRDCSDRQASLEGSERRPWCARRSEVVQPQQRSARAASAEALRMPIANLRDETNNEEVLCALQPRRRTRFHTPVFTRLRRSPAATRPRRNHAVGFLRLHAEAAPLRAARHPARRSRRGSGAA